MTGELLGLAFAVLLIPAIWQAQRIHDWWSQPSRAFFRRVWLVEHHFCFLYGGSAGSVGVETPLSAPGCPSPLHPGADTELQATAPAWSGDSVALPRATSPNPRPGRHPGRGPQPRTAAASPPSPRGEVAFPGGGGPGQSSRSEPVPPDLAPVGTEPHPRGEGVGAACPRQVAPTIRDAA